MKTGSTSDRAFLLDLTLRKNQECFYFDMDVTFLQRQLWVVTHKSDSSSCTRTQTECPGGFTHRVLFVNQSKAQQKDGRSLRGSACHSLTQNPFHDASFLYNWVCPTELHSLHWNLLSCLVGYEGKTVPDNKVMRVDLGPAAAVQQDPRVAHDGAAPVMLAFHRGHGGQQSVEIFWDVCGAVTIKNVVDDISRLQRALQDGDISLWVEESEDVLPAVGENKHSLQKKYFQWILERQAMKRTWWGWRGSC